MVFFVCGFLNLFVSILQNCIATHESNGIDIIIALILNDINPLGKKRMDLVLELKVSPGQRKRAKLRLWFWPRQNNTFISRECKTVVHLS